MRPFKGNHSHLWFELPEFFYAYGADETILLRPDIHYGYTDPTHRPAHVGFQHSSESRSQHPRLDG